MTYVDTTVAKNSAYYYRVLANGAVVGDVTMANFPTMSADSMVQLRAWPIDRTDTTATAPTRRADQPDGHGPGRAAGEPDVAGQREQRDRLLVSAARCVAPATTCSNFAQIATVGTEEQHGQRDVRGYDGGVGHQLPIPGGGVQRWRHLGRAYVTLATRWSSPRFRGADQLHGVGRQGQRQQLHGDAELDCPRVPARYPANFTIERATNLGFTTGLATFTAAGTREESHSDRDEEHGLLLQDPREQQSRRLVREHERPAVPDSHGSLTKNSVHRGGSNPSPFPSSEQGVHLTRK